MTPTHDLFEGAKSGSDKTDGGSDQSVGQSTDLQALFRRIWPKKTAVYLAIEADVTIRQAERIIGGKQGVGGRVLAQLLRGEHGAEILEVTMKGAMPTWWKEAFHERRITAARRKRQAAERELRELEGEA